MRKRVLGFTLIELLIVVAIIAILAAIAVPNFLEAQVRSKVSRAKADMRSLATALESYRVDQNQYPPDSVYYNMFRTPRIEVESPLYLLTTPLAYMTQIPSDVFPTRAHAVWNPAAQPQPYVYFGWCQWKYLQKAFHPEWLDHGYQWLLYTRGPDLQLNGGEYAMFSEEVLNSLGPPVWDGIGYPCLYDPTNGTTSAGDIIRVGP